LLVRVSREARPTACCRQTLCATQLNAREVGGTLIVERGGKGMFIKTVFFAPVVLIVTMVAISICAAQGHNFPNETGWSWYIKPLPAKNGMSLQQDSLLLAVKVHDGGIHVTVITFDDISGLWGMQAVAFDGANNRYVLTGLGGSSSNGTWLRSFLLASSQLSWDKVRFIGIEMMTQENYHTILVPQALNKLKAAGVECLSYPQVGKPYDFDLTTMHGSKVSSGTLRGKVVLIDFWATWCGPCMQLLPDLKKTYADLAGKAFEIIGVNMDLAAEKAQGAIAKEALPWPTVLAPINKEHRSLWQTAADIGPIPRLLLIDRKGVLRADADPMNVFDEIHKLMNE
jgi:thiol-disulfide isomerase/thioredoxin